MNAGFDRIVRALFVMAALVVSCTPASAANADGRVVRVVTATSDVHDLATAGDRTFVATSGGLVIRRGDRVERVMTSLDGLPGTRLRSVSVTDDGAIWVGGVEGTARIALEADGTPRVEQRVALRRVRRVARFAGATWLATFGDGLYRIRDGAGASTAPERIALDRAPAMKRQTDLLAHAGALWVATSGAGIVRIDGAGRLASRVRSGHGLHADIVWDLELDGDGERVLAATAGGVSILDGAGRVDRNAHVARASQRLPVRDVRAVRPIGSSGAIALATFGAGAFRIDPGVARPRPLGGRAIATETRALAIAGGDAIVIGHADGLHRVGADASRATALATGGLPASDVTSLARAFGALWIGTFSDGLARVEGTRASAVDRATIRWRVDRRINDLAVTRDAAGRETLWIATDRGLHRHDGRSFEPVLDPEAPGRVHVTSLHADARSGALWVTSSRQLSRFQSGRWRSWTGDERMPVMQLHAVTTDARGRVWVGSLHGLYRFDPERGAFERHTVSSGALPVDWVTALAPWGDGIVAGTYHGGLSWSDGRAFEIERESESGLPAGWVNPHAMTRVGDTLFIGTLERGLVVGRRGEWRRLRTSDGLPSDDVTAVLPDGEGAAWVATRGGLARVTY